MEKEKMEILVDKIKLVAKYTVNLLAIINALLIGLDPIWGIPYAMQISETLIVIMAVASTYLLGQKGYSTYKHLEDK